MQASTGFSRLVFLIPGAIIFISGAASGRVVVWLKRRPPAKQVTEDIYTGGLHGRRRINRGVAGPDALADCSDRIGCIECPTYSFPREISTIQLLQRR